MAFHTAVISLFVLLCSVGTLPVWTAHAPLQQWLQPALVALTVAVQEGQHITLRRRSPQQPGTHQALPLVGTDQAHLGQPRQLIGQSFLQVL